MAADETEVLGGLPRSDAVSLGTKGDDGCEQRDCAANQFVIRRNETRLGNVRTDAFQVTEANCLEPPCGGSHCASLRTTGLHGVADQPSRIDLRTRASLSVAVQRSVQPIKRDQRNDHQHVTHMSRTIDEAS